MYPTASSVIVDLPPEEIVASFDCFRPGDTVQLGKIVYGQMSGHGVRYSGIFRQIKAWRYGAALDDLQRTNERTWGKVQWHLSTALDLGTRCSSERSSTDK